ncbi:MAG: trypsin-like peptidase domain-containing protein [Proteobacteria bacterium]|nr:trypsin-like peptidase domain-containing protein [Pseudomonadota bacterium]
MLAQAPPSAQLDRLAGRGTGFFVDSAGAILTGGHVVAACRAISIALADGAERWVRVVATDARQDLALLHGADTAPAAAVFHPEPREAPLVDLNLIGFPGRAAQPTATPVALSSDQRLAAAEQYRFQADVHRGHSGAPILDASGRVIGVVRAMIDPASADRTGEPVVGELGLAVANPAVLAFLDAHGVRYRTAAPTPSDSAPLTRARRFLVQVRCWR